MRQLALALTCSFALSTGAVAQSLNIDFDSGSTPSSSFGAAAGQTGTWSQIGTIYWTVALPIVGLSGASSGVFVSGGTPLSQPGVAFASVPGTTGDDSFLLEDALALQGAPQPWSLTLSPLQPGTYDVYTYACTPSSTVGIRVNGSAIQTLGGPWTGGYVQGVTHALHPVTVGTAGSITVETSGASIVSGVQLVRHDTPYESYCPTGALGSPPCPCGNEGNLGRGCGNSVTSAGARLGATGIASSTTANDTFRLVADGLPNGPALFFQGTAQVSGGPVAFGDGLRCVAGVVTRLAVVSASGNVASFPPPSVPPGSNALSLLGGVSAGSVLHYQAWYRDTGAYCTPNTFNLTNAIRTTWAP